MKNEICLVTEEPVHWMKFGGILHSLGNYVDLDYELPYFKLFPYEEMIFDNIEEIDLKNKFISFTN